jgi:hypothetical protein
LPRAALFLETPSLLAMSAAIALTSPEAPCVNYTHYRMPI